MKSINKKDKNLLKAVDHIISECGNISNGDKVLILYDDETKNIGEIFKERCELHCINIITTQVRDITRHGQEPHKEIAYLMSISSLIFCLCQKSLAHTEARKVASCNGARFLSLPEYNYDLLLSEAILCDYKSVYPLAKKLSNILDRGSKIIIKSKDDKIITSSINGREANCCPGFVSNPGELGSPPDIEANICPIESSTNGQVIIDGSITCEEIGLLKTDVLLSFENGFVENIYSKDKKLENTLNNILGEKKSKRRILGEIGIGLNPLAQLTGIMLTDEGTLGSVHFGLGSNITVGGQNKIDFHLDFVFMHPTIEIDNKTIMDRGKIKL